MATATFTEPTTSHNQFARPTTQPTNTPLSQSERSAANRLRTTMAAVKLSFTWLGVRKTLAPVRGSRVPSSWQSRLLPRNSSG